MAEDGSRLRPEDAVLAWILDLPAEKDVRKEASALAAHIEEMAGSTPFTIRVRDLLREIGRSTPVAAVRRGGRRLA